MANEIEKSFGFGNGSSYTSFTFNRNNDLLVAANGPLEIGSIRNELPNLILEDVTFIQEGIIVKKLGTSSVTFPANLPVPFYLTATVPDTREIDNIIWGFVRRPQDIGENLALIAEWDGQEWRPLDKLTLNAIAEDREARARAYGNLGFNTGFRFSPAPDFSSFLLTRGQITDKTGQLINKEQDTFFNAIPADVDFDRIDTILWRRLNDNPNRIGFPNLFPGGTFSGTTISQIKNNIISDDTIVSSKSKLILLEDNSYIMFYLEDYGINASLKAIKYASDRVTVLQAATTIETGVLDYDVSKGFGNKVDIAIIKDDNLYRLKILDTDLSINLASALIENLNNPVINPVIRTDFQGNSHILFLYQNSPTQYTPYYMKLNVGGSISIPAFRLIFTSASYNSIDFKINEDLELFVVYGNETQKRVEFNKLDEVGQELTQKEVVSEDVWDGVNVVTGNIKNVQIELSLVNRYYISWVQEKTPGNFGFVISYPGLLNNTGHLAQLVSYENTNENIIAHKMSIDWQEHAHLILSTETQTLYYKYYLPAFNTRLLGTFQVSATPSSYVDHVYDRQGALVTAYVEKQTGTTNNGAPIASDWFTGAGSFGSEAVFIAANEIAVKLSTLGLLSPIPTIGDSFFLSDSASGNIGNYEIVDQRDSVINSITYRIYKTNVAFSTSEDAGDNPTSALQFFELDGNKLHVAKQSSAVLYGFSEIYAEELDTDSIAALIRTSDNAFVSWYENVSLDANTTFIRTENVVACAGEVSWDTGTNNGTLVWSSQIDIIDPFRGVMKIASGSINNFVEGEVLYVNLPKSQFFLEDGAADVGKIVDVSPFYVGLEVLVGDSDSNQLITTIASVGIGELTFDDPVDQFTKVRGAYVIPLQLQLKKEKQNEGALRPTSLGEIDSSIFTIALRKDNLVHFRGGSLSLENGETGNIGDGTSNPNLTFMGALSQADSTPKYSTALGSTIKNFKVVENESLKKSIKRLDQRTDTIPRVNLIDLVRTALPLVAPASIDGITITTGQKIFFPYVDEKIYIATVTGTVISYEAVAAFGEGIEAGTDGKMVKVTGGNTNYLKTIWERTEGEWAPIHVKEATDEPSGFKFADLSDSEISFDNNTRTFTITPTGAYFDYFVKGKVYRKDTAQSVQIPDIEGEYFFYFDGDTLVAVNTFDISIVLDKAYVSYAYWDADNQDAIILGEERHGITMDGATHRYLHLTRGTRIQSGFSAGSFELGGDGDLASDATIGIGNGVLFDEDLVLNVNHSDTPSAPLEQILFPVAEIPVFYRSGATGVWRKTAANQFPVKVGTNRIQYNSLQYSVWQTIDVPADNYYSTMWIFATNNTEEPVIAIMGQSYYDTLSSAQEQEVFAALALGNFPFAEWKLCFRMIFETDSTFTNGAKSALRDLQDLRAGADNPFPSVAPSDHGLLSGLDDPDHGPTAVTTNGVIKDGAFTASDEDLEQALDTLNKLLGQLRIREHDTDKKRVVVTGANRVLNSGITMIQELKNLVLEFDGAEIDFETGEIFESDGVTPLGDPFTPETIPTGEFFNYSVTLLPNVANEIKNTITGQIIVLPAPSSAALKDDTSEPPFAKGTKLGVITVQENSGTIGNITESDIKQLGTGGGSGSGSGDSFELVGRLQNRLNLTDFKYAATNIFIQQEDTLIDDLSTAAFSVVNSNYSFENTGDFLLSTNMFGTQYLSNNAETKRAEITHYIDTDFPGLDAIVEISRDGGNTFQTVSLDRVGVSDTTRGNVEFQGNDTGYSQVIGGAPTGFQEFDNTNQMTQAVTLTGKTTIKEIVLDLTLTGNPTGYIYAELRKDNGGSPDFTVDGFIARSKFASIDLMVTGNNTIDANLTAPAEDYHIVLKTDDHYKATYNAGVTQVALNNTGALDATSTLNGYEHDMRVKITRGVEELTSQGFGILYQYSKGEVFEEGAIRQQEFSFNGAIDNEDTFTLDWFPDRRVLMCFEIGTGQVYRYGLKGFLIEGKDIIFEPNTFNKPEDIVLEFVEMMGSNLSNDDFFTGLLNSANIGAPGQFESFLKSGRGYYFKRPDGIIRELTIDNNDEIQIYSVD